MGRVGSCGWRSDMFSKRRVLRRRIVRRVVVSCWRRERVVVGEAWVGLASLLLPLCGCSGMGSVVIWD